MPLDNTAKIADIISLLQSVQGTNQRADLASVIGSPAVGTDPVATLIGMLQTDKNNMASRLVGFGESAAGTESMDSLVAKIPNTPRKKIASGVVTAEGDVSAVIYADGSNTSATFTKIQVTGLDFLPSKIIALATGLSTDRNTVVYFDSPLNGSNNGTIGVTWGYTANVATRNIANIRKDGTHSFVNNGGFRLPVVSPGTVYTWWAFE